MGKTKKKGKTRFASVPLFLILSLFLALLFSQTGRGEEAPEPNLFSAKESITPPAVPQQKAQESPLYDYNFFLFDASSSQRIGGVHAEVTVVGETSNQKKLVFIPPGQPLQLSLQPGRILLTIRADSPRTQGADYFASLEFFLEPETRNLSLFLVAASSVRGFAVDAEGNLVEGATLTADCSNALITSPSVRSDSSGSFRFDWLPAGQCMIKAVFDGSTGSQELNLSRGDLKSISIVLKTRVKANPVGVELLAGLITVLLFAALAVGANYFAGRKKRRLFAKEDSASPEGEPPIPSLGSRAEAVLRTLEEGERSVVEALLSEPEKPLSQASLCRKTGISKTSMARKLKTLENKGIITIEKTGKLKKAKITDWFLQR